MIVNHRHILKMENTYILIIMTINNHNHETLLSKNQKVEESDKTIDELEKLLYKKNI